MNSITRVNHIGIRVSDFKLARDFYAQLGFEYITGPSGPEPVAVVAHQSGVVINFILNANQDTTLNQLMDIPTKHTGYTHMALEVDNAEQAINDLKEMGIPLSGDPMEHPSGTSFFIRDPDANVIEFIEAKG